MPIVANPFCLCAPKQTMLDAHFTTQQQKNRDNYKTSTLQYLFSAQNIGGRRLLSTEIATAQGKKRPVVIQYDNQPCVTACVKNTTCDVDPNSLTIASDCVTYDLQEQWTACSSGTDNVSLSFTCEQLNQYCEQNNTELIEKSRAKFIDKFFQGMDKAMLTIIDTMVDATEKLPMFITTASGVRIVHPNLVSRIEELMYTRGYMPGEYAILGGQTLRNLMNHLKIASASCEGYDISNQLGLPMMYQDAFYDSVIGANTILVLPYAVIQPVWFNEYANDFCRHSDETLVQDVLFYNTGNGVRIPYDYRWEKKPKCPEVTFFPFLYMELWKAVCKDCDVADCGIIKIEDCSPAEVVCP